MSDAAPIIGARASSVLYRILAARTDRRPFLLPANICPIVPIAFMKAGMPFELVDIAPDTLHMDLDVALSRARSGAIGGVLYAHTYGEASTPYAAFAALKAADRSLLLIDDRCLCKPDLERDARNAADVILYSTGHAKVVQLGLGGYAFVADSLPLQAEALAYDPDADAAVEKDYKRALAERQRFEYRDSPWLRLQLDPALSWSDLRSRILAMAPEAAAHSRALNAIYAARLPAALQLPAAYQDWRFNLRVDPARRDDLMQKVFAAGLFCSAHYASLGGIMGDGQFPVANSLAASVLNLFNDHHFSADKAERVCEVILNELGD